MLRSAVLVSHAPIPQFERSNSGSMRRVHGKSRSAVTVQSRARRELPCKVTPQCQCRTSARSVSGTVPKTLRHAVHPCLTPHAGPFPTNLCLSSVHRASCWYVYTYCPYRGVCGSTAALEATLLLTMCANGLLEIRCPGPQTPGVSCHHLHVPWGPMLMHADAWGPQTVSVSHMVRLSIHVHEPPGYPPGGMRVCACV